MKKIPSFTIDHIRLLRGIYVSRQDEVNGETVTTFDIRMKEPNREPALGQGALHTIEHLAPPTCVMTRSGRTRLSIGAPWAASPVIIC